MTDKASKMDVEQLSYKLHEVYQKEATRQGDVRHAEEYKDLPERIKDFDRALARYIIAREQSLKQEHEMALEEIKKPLMAWKNRDTTEGKRWGGEIPEIDEALAIIEKDIKDSLEYPEVKIQPVKQWSGEN